MEEDIRKAVQDAASEQNDVEDTQDNEKPVSKEKKETEEKDEEEPDKQRVNAALSILETLEDPKKGRAFARALLSQFEEKTEGDSKADKKDAAKDLIESLANELEESDRYLLKPVLKIFEKLLGSRDEAIVKHITESEERQARERYQDKYDTFIDTNQVTKDEQKLMKQFAGEVQAREGESFNSYMNRLLRFAKLELRDNEKKESKSEKMEANRKRDAFNKRGASEKDSREAPVINSPRDAVMAALAQLQEER